MIRAHFRLPLVIAALLALPGCTGYRLGSMLPEDVHSIYIPTFVNRTREPQLEVETTSAAVEEFQKDGSLQVVSEDAADTILNVTLLEYTQDAISYQRDRQTAAREYRATIFASVTLTRRSDGSEIARYRRVKGETTFQLGGDLSTSKRLAIPDAAADLAHNIVEKVVEAWQ